MGGKSSKDILTKEELIMLYEDTGLDKTKLTELSRFFVKNGKIRYTQFLSITELKASILSKNLFDEINSAKNGVLNIRDIIKAYRIVEDGNLEFDEKMEFTFRLFCDKTSDRINYTSIESCYKELIGQFQHIDLPNDKALSFLNESIKENLERVLSMDQRLQTSNSILTNKFKLSDKSRVNLRVGHLNPRNMNLSFSEYSRMSRNNKILLDNIKSIENEGQGI